MTSCRIWPGAFPKMDSLTRNSGVASLAAGTDRALHQDVCKAAGECAAAKRCADPAHATAGGAKTLASDDAVYQSLGVCPSDISTSEALLDLLKAGYRRTPGTWHNLTATTPNTVTRRFEDALDRAWLQK